MSVWLRNRRTGYAFRTKRSQRQGRYVDEVIWLRDHGYVFFNQTMTPDGYVWETWVDNFGNVVHFKVYRPSGSGEIGYAVIVESRYVPAQY